MPDVNSVRTLRRRATGGARFEWSTDGERWHPCMNTTHAVQLLRGNYKIREIQGSYSDEEEEV